MFTLGAGEIVAVHGMQSKITGVLDTMPISHLSEGGEQTMVHRLYASHLFTRGPLLGGQSTPRYPPWPGRKHRGLGLYHLGMLLSKIRTSCGALRGQQQQWRQWQGRLSENLEYRWGCTEGRGCVWRELRQRQGTTIISRVGINCGDLSSPATGTL